MTLCDACRGQLYYIQERDDKVYEQQLHCLLCGREPGSYPIELKARKYEAQYKWCGNGHLLTPDNILMYRGLQDCRECSLDADRAHTHRQRLARDVVSAPKDLGNCPKGHPYVGSNITIDGDCVICTTPRQQVGKEQLKPRAPKTHCLNGHELIPKNLTSRAIRDGHLECRPCQDNRRKASRLRAKERVA